MANSIKRTIVCNKGCDKVSDVHRLQGRWTHYSPIDITTVQPLQGLSSRCFEHDSVVLGKVHQKFPRTKKRSQREESDVRVDFGGGTRAVSQYKAPSSVL